MEILESSVSSLSPNDTSAFAMPAMHFLSSTLLWGALAFQAVLGLPGIRAPSSVDSFIQVEEPFALEQLLCNIGPDGCHACGVDPGLVIASPSTVNPDYFYTWTRDSGLVLKSLVDRFTHYYDAGLQRHIELYIGSQAKIQGIEVPSGSLVNGSGLGEPKYNVDSTAYTEPWGRPQRDGPALRAIAMISYANWLIDNDFTSTVEDVIWPILRNDLDYVAEYWNNTGFDLWEEIDGSSFFTVASQHRALVQGKTLATTLGHSADSYTAIAPQLLCFLQTFWVPSKGYLDANTNVDDGRSGLDANTLLGSIHTFDHTLGCDASTFQPCSDKALSNHKAVVDSFRFYSINSEIPAGTALAVGRYASDVYFDGNPWYLTTLAAAEQLYDALFVWQQQGFIEVTEISLSFFQDLYPNVKTGTYPAKSTSKSVKACAYDTLFNAVSAYADGFVGVVAKYTPADGHLAEQFSKANGTALSAADLTWSYAAFLTAVARRNGIVPPAWADDSATSIPETCLATSVVGSYSSATATTFPSSQTPITGAPPPPTTTAAATTTSACVIATPVAVAFEELVETELGQSIKIVGSIGALGSWSPENAIALDASDYTSENPLWKVTVKFKAGQVIEYKYIKVGSDGSITWEADPNHTYTVPASAATQSDSWQL